VVCLLFVVDIPLRLTLDNLGGHLHVDAECASCYKTQSVRHCCYKAVKIMYAMLLLPYGVHLSPGQKRYVNKVFLYGWNNSLL
jgi:hypothetical protein